MKNIIVYMCCGVVFVLVLGAFMYGTRMFSNATTPITVHQVKAGVTCATMVTSDGAAISCWKD